MKPHTKIDLLSPKLVKDSNGRVYQTLPSGQILRLSPQRPWRGKAERKAVLRHRRNMRAQEELP